MRSSACVAYELKKTVVLVGMMGAGKTAVGTALARLLNVPFIDQDDEIERAANRTIAEIFRDHGEPFFRQKETQVLERLLSAKPMVLSTGGGAYLQERNRDLIGSHATALWLDAPLDLLWARVRHRTTRPLLMTSDPYQTLADMVKVRTPFYAQAPIHVRAEHNRSVEDMAKKVRDTLAEHPEVLKANNHVQSN
ncbi:shikimate kinase [Qingshengfaniella alkalisoli]|uniref:Shikimate kinase n=1 Tax=Qingshengfaniella alkalisoli TaxID=2599296 RepID=A0A5B8I6R3_9RHOB|nr:shikimate kinase [Qingshengfaniella alkalisoli]QDY69159.1 shikimate kinase [Qingshengfaniella alkalisoli]